MRLRDYVGKNIIVHCIDGIDVKGLCYGFTQAIDNEPEVDEIDLKPKGDPGLIGITAPEIKSIEIIED